VTWGSTGTLTARWTESSTLSRIRLPQQPISSRSATACVDVFPHVSRLLGLASLIWGFSIMETASSDGLTASLVIAHCIGCSQSFLCPIHTSNVLAMDRGGFFGGSLHRIMLTGAACRRLNSVYMCACRRTAVRACTHQHAWQDLPINPFAALIFVIHVHMS